MISREYGEKPQNSFRHVFRMDAYNDWVGKFYFNTKEEAEAFIAEAKTATLETA
jgi:hypothetical protein